VGSEEVGGGLEMNQPTGYSNQQDSNFGVVNNTFMIGYTDKNR
jgi:hypothetical protein